MRTPVYLAARFERQAELRGYRMLLETSGLYRVTSRWLDEDGLALGKSEETRQRVALMDLADIHSAELFIQLTDDQPNLRGGMHVEFGFALALTMHDRVSDVATSRDVIVCGPRTNVFQWTPGVRWIPTVSQLLAELSVSEKVEEISDFITSDGRPCPAAREENK